MLFTITGNYKGRPAFITWDDGELTGSPSAIRALKRKAAKTHAVGIPAIPAFSTWPENHLENPHAACLLMGEILHPVTEANGQLPRIPEQEAGTNH